MTTFSQTSFEKLLAGVEDIRPAPQEANAQQLFSKSAFEQILSGVEDFTPPSSTPQRKPGIFGEFGQGIQAGFSRLGTDFVAAGAAGAQAFGFDESAKELADLAQVREEDINERLPPTIGRVEEIGSVGDFAHYAARTLGEQVPIMASILIGGGVAGVLGRLVGRGFLTAAEATAVAPRLTAISQGTGAVATATGLETGESVLEQLDAIGRIDPGLAFGAGIAKGALEAVVPLALGARFGLTPDLSAGLLNKVSSSFSRLVPGRLATATAVGSGEAVTEVLQESIDIGVRDFIDDNYDSLGAEGRSRLLNAASGGLLVGFIFGGISGSHRRDGGGANQGSPASGDGTQVPPAPSPATRTPDEVDPTGPSSPAAPSNTTSTVTASPEIAIVTGANTDFLQFEPAARAQISQVREDAEKAPAYRVDTSKLREEDVTSDVTALPNNEQELSPANARVRVLKSETADLALAEAQKAVALRNQAVAGFIGQSSETATGYLDLSEANSALRRAVDLGFRFVPQEGDGFFVTRKLEESELIPTDVVNIPTNIGSTFDPIISLGTDAAGITALGRDARSFTEASGGLPASDINRSFRIDPSRIPIEDRTSTRTDKAIATIAFQEVQAGAVRDLEHFKQLLSEETSLFLAPGTSDADIQRIQELVEQLPEGKKASLIPTVRMKQNRLFNLMFKRGLRIRLAKGEAGAFIGGVKKLPPGAILEEIPTSPITRRGPASAASAFQTDRMLKEYKEPIGEDGEPYDFDAHVPGTVQIVYDRLAPPPKSELKQLRHVKAFYQAAMKRFGMTEGKLILAGSTAITNMLSDARGAFRNVAGGHGVIFLLGDNITSIRGYFSTAVHEFGHFLFTSEFHKAPEAIRAKVLSAYNRSLIKINAQTIAAFQTTSLGPSKAAEFASSQFSPIRTPQLFVNNNARPNYWFNLDEWAAEQLVRMATTHQRTPLDSVERFFKRLGRRMLSLFKAGGKLQGMKIEDFKPAEEFVAWTELLRTRNKNDPTQALLQMPMEEGQQQSQADNELLLDLPPGEGAPDAPVTEHYNQLFKALGLEGRKAQEISADTSRMNWLVRWGWNLVQLADQNKHIAELQRYRELVQQWWTFKMKWISRADTRVREWRALGKNDTDNLAKFIFDVDKMTYLTKEEVEAGVVRMPTDADLAVLVKKHSLSPEAFQLYTRIREDFVAVLNQIEKTTVKDINRTITDPLAKQTELAGTYAEFEALRKRPYFPHSRFGDFSAVVKNKNGKTVYFEQFVTKKEAKTAAEELQKEYSEADGYRVRFDKIPDSVMPFRGLPPTLLNLIKNRLNLSPEQLNGLDQLTAEFLPTKSFRKRLQKREDTPGYSLDAMRSYANYFFHGANYFARIEFHNDLQDTITDLNQRTSNVRGAPADATQLRSIADFLQDHFNNIMNPQRDWAALRSFAFQWWLGFSPASALVNFTQIPLVAWPYLSSRFGDTKALIEIKKAVLSIHKIYQNKEGSIPADEFAAVNRGIAQGPLDESQATELAGTAEGDNLQRLLPGTRAQRFLMQSAHWSAFMFQTSEKINRRIVFRAAYRLAKQNPNAAHIQELKDTNPLEYESLLKDGFSELEAGAYLSAIDAVTRTQFEYAQWARPRFMRGRAGTLLTFFMFVQNMVWFARYSPGRTRFLLMMLFTAGLMGLPGAEDIAAIAKLLGRKLLGVDFDVEREVREFVVDLMGDSISPDLILHGASRVGFGLPTVGDALGIPIPKFDLSANLGLGQIIPGVAQLGQTGGTFEDKFANVTTDVAGASFGIGINLLKFFSDDALPIDDAKRWERAMPRALRNVVRAARFAEEGRERTRNDETVVEFDISDPVQAAEVIAQGLGFTPTRLSRVWDKKAMEREAIAYWEIRKRMLLKQYDRALTSRDNEVKADVLAAVRRYNNEVPFPPQRISGETLSTSRKQRVQQRRKAELGIPASKSLLPLSREIDRLTPEVEDVTRVR